MFHLIAFSVALLTTNVGTNVSVVLDPTISINGTTFALVPDKVNQIAAMQAFCTAGTAATKVQPQTPSLREVFFPSITPLKQNATPDVAPFIFEAFDSPIQLATNEGLNIQSDALSASAAGQQGALVLLSDGPRSPVGKSRIFTMRATSTITQAANTWVNGQLTFDQTLPVGNYDIVGMRAQATGLLAARLVFIGTSAVTRPGCPGNADASTADFYSFRFGRIGTWGTFNSLTPPSVDVLGATGTSQVYYLDLVQR